MIIKSMSRKEATFAQLYDYITRDGDHDTSFTYTQNFILKDRDEILREFERNAELLSKRKNGNYLYHEVISISRAKQISEQRQKELLQDIISQYSKSRGKDCLIFGGLHDEKDNNLHYHLIISANKYNETRRYSLKKATFNKIKKQTELYVLERYPELEQAKLISKEITIGKTNNKEEEFKRRTGKPSQKDLFKARLVEIFANSVDKQNFFDNLKEASIEIYTRGKNIGFVDLANNRKHRLKTLGLEAEFEAVNRTITSTKEHEPGKQESKTQGKSKPEAGISEAPVDSKKADHNQKKPQSSQGKESTISPEEDVDAKQKIVDERKESIRRKRQQWNKGKDDSNKHKQWSETDEVVVDILGMFDGVLSMFSVAKSASEATPEDSNDSKTTVDERVETTKTETHRIVEKRKEEMKERRKQQKSVKHQHRRQHRQWLKETIKRTKSRVFRTLHRLNNFLITTKQYVNKRSA